MRDYSSYFYVLLAIGYEFRPVLNSFLLFINKTTFDQDEHYEAVDGRGPHISNLVFLPWTCSFFVGIASLHVDLILACDADSK